MPAKCKIMTDSCCDFTLQESQAEGVECLPFTYTEAGKPDGLNGVDDLFQSRTAHEFYEAIRNGACPMTSQPSQLVFEEAFERVQAEGVPTVYFSISSGISGGAQGAQAALDRVRENHGGKLDTPVYVVDLLMTSTTQNLFMHQAAIKRDEGLTAEEMVAWAKDAIFRTHTIFMVDNLDSLHRGGRIPKSVALIGGLLDVKPLLTWRLDGTLTIVGVSRGRRKALRKMEEFYEKYHRDDEYGPVVAVGDADCVPDGDSLARTIKEKHHGVRVYRSTIGPTIGSHVGPGMLSCCFWGVDRRRGDNDAAGEDSVKGVSKS